MTNNHSFRVNQSENDSIFLLKNIFDNFPNLNYNLDDSNVLDSKTDNFPIQKENSHYNKDTEKCPLFKLETFNNNSFINFDSFNYFDKQLIITKDSTLSNYLKQGKEFQALGVKKARNEKIFKLLKYNIHIGRIRKNTNFIGKHNKFSEDNIIRKIKGRFHEKCRIYINKEYKRFILSKKPYRKNVKNLLQRINPKISRKIKKEDNLKWLNSKLYEIFSENISVKYCIYETDYNKKAIEKIYKENEAKNVIEILNKPVRFMYNAFIQNIKIPGFDNLDEDINELKIKMKKDNEEDIEDYLSKYEQIAKNLENIFIRKIPRNNK